MDSTVSGAPNYNNKGTKRKKKKEFLRNGRYETKSLYLLLVTNIPNGMSTEAC